jgi:hypothetical protein
MKKLTWAEAFLTEKHSSAAIAKLISKNKSTKSTKPTKYVSKIIDYWVTKSSLINYSKKSRLDIIIPNNFSIIDNPKSVINTISQISATARSNKKIHHIVYNHSNMTKHDLAAESLLGLIAKEFKNEYTSKKRKLKISGHFPRNADLTQSIKVIGLIKDLGIRHEYLPQERENMLQTFNMASKKQIEKISSGASDYKELAAKKFVDHINKCLNRISKALTAAAMDSLGEYAGEILDNAIEHGGIGDWTIRSYFDAQHTPPICEIAIIDFGKTMAETFLDLREDSYAYKSVRAYIVQHESQGMFSPYWSKETLLTLAALQGDISSKNKSTETDRGQGTVEMIDFFIKMHSECSQNNSEKAKMVLLSGNTQIIFDGTYKMKSDKNGRKTIAFNNENSLLKPPDRNYVKNLEDVNVPGTIISIKFCLQESSMQRA